MSSLSVIITVVSDWSIEVASGDDQPCDPPTHRGNRQAGRGASQRNRRRNHDTDQTVLDGQENVVSPEIGKPRQCDKYYTLTRVAVWRLRETYSSHWPLKNIFPY